MESGEKFIDKLIQSKCYLFAGIFAVIFLCNLSILTNLPYWDEIMGLHNQAIYLARSNFDFASLYTPEQSYTNGGSCIYPFGIMPLAYGVLYWALPPLTVHVIAHLVNMVALAVAGMLFIRLAARFVSPRMALLWGVVALSEPIVTSRMAAMGQEAVLTALVMLGVYLFLEGKIWRAIAVGALSCFIKFTGILLLLALITYFVYILMAKQEEGRRLYLKYLAVAVVVCGLLFGLYVVTAYPGQDNSSGILKMGLALVTFHTEMFYPWISLKLSVGIIGFLVIFYRSRTIFIKDRKYVLLPILIIGYFVAYYLSSAPQLPRYTAIIILPMTLMLAFVLKKCQDKNVALITIFLVVVQLINQHGALLPPMHHMDFPLLERSREYLRAVESDQRLSRTLEEQSPDIELICKVPYPQILTMPELRYVTKPLPNIRAYGIVPQYCSAKAATKSDFNENAILLYAANSMDPWFQPEFTPNADCNIYYVDRITPQTPGLAVFSGLLFSKTPKEGDDD